MMERGAEALSPQYLFFPQTESQCNRTFPTVWWHLRMRERPPVGFQRTKSIFYPPSQEHTDEKRRAAH